MANVVNYLSQIQTGQTIQAVHVNQFVDALSGSVAYDLRVSGSLTVIGPLNATASYANIATTALGNTSGYTPSGSIISFPGILKVFAGAGQTSVSPPYQAIVNVNPNTDLTGKILNQSLFLATAPSQSGATIGVVTSSPTSITFQSNLPSIDFTFIGTYI